MRASAERKRRDQALSEVVGFVLLLAVVVSALSIWMTYVVPANGREAEITQMNAVKDGFTDYKFSLDSLWTNNQTGVTLSTNFNLGTPGSNTQAGGPFMFTKPIASSASLSVQDPGDTLMINSSSATTDMVMNMGTVEYQSMNNYWIQESYVYETGGVFLQQDEGSVCRISPPFSIVRANNGTADVAYVNLVPIRVLAGGSVSGNGPVRIDSMMQTVSQKATLQPNYWVNISFNMSDKQSALMMMNMLNETRIRGNITESSWYKCGVSENPVTKRGTAFMRIEGPLGSTNPDVYLTLRTVDYVVTLNNIASVIS
ncbi:hypothetical protein [uncultured Methanoregula sp.]|uniref:hypothetical protein n=1 Tax=uncultured Methanoregula sp. TaxID=1005933 RepID=UPI002AAC40F6|nr:hypothetical protein [uncultured Methanoregula sp.]